jgi:hypothetical protein
MTVAPKPRRSDPHEAWQRHYERALGRRSRVRRVRRRRAASRFVYRHRRLLGLVIAIGALYAAALIAAFIL